MNDTFTNSSGEAGVSDGRRPWVAPKVIGTLPLSETRAGSVTTYAEGQPTPFVPGAVGADS